MLQSQKVYYLVRTLLEARSQEKPLEIGTVEEGVESACLPVIPLEMLGLILCHTVKTVLETSVTVPTVALTSSVQGTCPLCTPHEGKMPQAPPRVPLFPELDQRWPHLQADFIPLGWSDVTLCPL